MTFDEIKGIAEAWAAGATSKEIGRLADLLEGLADQRDAVEEREVLARLTLCKGDVVPVASTSGSVQAA